MRNRFDSPFPVPSGTSRSAKVGLRVGFAAAIHDALAATPGETLAAPALTVGSGPLNAYVAGLGRRFGHGRARGDVRLVGNHAVVTPAAPAAGRYRSGSPP